MSGFYLAGIVSDCQMFEMRWPRSEKGAFVLILGVLISSLFIYQNYLRMRLAKPVYGKEFPQPCNPVTLQSFVSAFGYEAKDAAFLPLQQGSNGLRANWGFGALGFRGFSAFGRRM
jgi:hypothetical protein